MSQGDFTDDFLNELDELDQDIDVQEDHSEDRKNGEEKEVEVSETHEDDSFLKDEPTSLEKLLFLLELGEPVLMWSAPGTGKTAITEQLQEKRGYHVETIIASIRQPQDFLGYPYQDNGQLKFYPPDWAIRSRQKLDNGEDVVIFFDEITTCPPTVLASMLRVVNEKVCGDISLKGARIICAANPKNESGGFYLTKAMENRFIHIEWNPSLDDWGLWIEGVDPPVINYKFKSYSKEKFKEYLRYAREFLSIKDVYDNEIRKRPNKIEHAWSSRRTMTILCKMLSFMDSNNIPFNRYGHDVIFGTIGSSAGTEFMKFIREKSLLRISDAFSNLKALHNKSEDIMSSFTSYVSFVLRSSLGETDPEEEKIYNDFAQTNPNEDSTWNKLLVVTNYMVGSADIQRYALEYIDEYVKFANTHNRDLGKSVIDYLTNDDKLYDKLGHMIDNKKNTKQKKDSSIVDDKNDTESIEIDDLPF